jgi:hypothetical protein
MRRQIRLPFEPVRSGGLSLFDRRFFEHGPESSGDESSEVEGKLGQEAKHGRSSKERREHVSSLMKSLRIVK